MTYSPCQVYLYIFCIQTLYLLYVVVKKILLYKLSFYFIPLNLFHLYFQF